MHSIRIFWWSTAVLYAALVSPGNAQSRIDVVIPASRDATLYDDPNGTLSNGGGELFVGLTASGLRRRALIAFDIAAAVPAGSRIVFAQITLNVAQTSAVGPDDVQVHRVLANWGEGSTVAAGNGGSGALAQPGDATWVHRFSPTPLWQTPGGDYEPVFAVQSPAPLSGAFRLGTSSRMIADVQDWLDGLRPNYGWLLKTDELASSTARRITCSENATVALRPQLAIGYVPAGNAYSVGIGCFGSGGLPFTQTITNAPVQGNICQLSMSQGVPGTLAVTFMSFGISANPVDIEPGCTIWLEILPFPSFGFRVLDATGQWTDSYLIPMDSNLFGAPVAFQSAAFDFALPRGYVASNAHLVVFR
jgi:hypothetical protein